MRETRGQGTTGEQGARSRPDAAAGTAGTNAGTGPGGTGTGARATPGQSTGTSATAGGTSGGTRVGPQTGSQSERERNVSMSRERPTTGRQTAGRRGGPSPLDQLGIPSAHAGQHPSSPFSLMSRFMDDVDQLFSGFGFAPTGGALLSPLTDIDDVAPPFPVLREATPTLWSPPIEVFERGNDLVVRADLPGVSRDDVNVEIEDGVLTISGERRSEHEESGQGFYRSERSYGAFARSIPLPEGVSEDACNASFKDGVLEITIPKPQVQQQRGRKIEIK